MLLVCQQPNYFPWLGYLEQCARSETLVILDSIQWMRRGWQHRARILPHPGQERSPDFQWLTLPVQGQQHREHPLGELLLAERQHWHRDHWSTLQTVYGKRPCFKSQLEPWIKPWFEEAGQYETMAQAATASVRLCLEILELKPSLIHSSELKIEGAKTDRLIAICHELRADTYYSGMSSTYLLPSQFEDAGIQLLWQRWKHPEYDQGRNSGNGRCKTHLSFLDVLANVPVSEIRQWLLKRPPSLDASSGQAFKPEGQEPFRLL
ncbi:MAG: WbqC family protein [Methylotenera sp.]|nr:WbqC family protein [Oligoflexia bacterium]